MGPLDDLIKNQEVNDLSGENLLDIICSENIIERSLVIENMNKSLEVLRIKIINSDIPSLYNDIVDNYKKIRLFHKKNHPSGFLLKILCYKILEILGYKHNFTTDEDYFLENCLNDWKVPILPCVSRILELSFDTYICHSKYDPEIVDIKSYVKKYILEFK